MCRYKAVLWIRIPNPDLDPAFQVNLRNHGFHDQKLNKIQTAENFFISLQFTYPQTFIKDAQATGEAFSPQKRTSSTAKDEIYKLFSFFGHFCPHESGL
jgi:hypothetical protein